MVTIVTQSAIIVAIVLQSAPIVAIVLQSAIIVAIVLQSSERRGSFSSKLHSPPPLLRRRSSREAFDKLNWPPASLGRPARHPFHRVFALVALDKPRTMGPPSPCPFGLRRAFERQLDQGRS